MAEGSTVLVDTAPWIYLLEDHPEFAPRFLGLFEAAQPAELWRDVLTQLYQHCMTSPACASLVPALVRNRIVNWAHHSVIGTDQYSEPEAHKMEWDVQVFEMAFMNHTGWMDELPVSELTNAVVPFYQAALETNVQMLERLTVSLDGRVVCW